MIQIVHRHAPAGTTRASIDAAMRLGGGQWPNTIATKLMDEWVLPVISPSRCPRVGWIEPGQIPEDVRLLHSRLDSWRLWSTTAPKQASPLLFDDATAVVLAAEQGLGVALTRWALVVDAVKEGRLVQVGPMIPYRYSYYWVTPQERAEDPLDATLFQLLGDAARDADPGHRPRTGCST